MRSFAIFGINRVWIDKVSILYYIYIEFILLLHTFLVIYLLNTKNIWFDGLRLVSFLMHDLFLLVQVLLVIIKELLRYCILSYFLLIFLYLANVEYSSNSLIISFRVLQSVSLFCTFDLWLTFFISFRFDFLVSSISFLPSLIFLKKCFESFLLHYWNH